jgi:hypothetical protein
MAFRLVHALAQLLPVLVPEVAVLLTNQLAPGAAARDESRILVRTTYSLFIVNDIRKLNAWGKH